MNPFGASWPFWLIAGLCGACQVLQALVNGAAARAGLGAVWTGALSATISALGLLAVGALLFRLPLPGWPLVQAQGPKFLFGGAMGAVIVAGLAAAAPRLGPTQTFLAYFGVITVISVAIDHFGLLGTAAKTIGARQLIGFALAACGLLLARS